MFTSRIVCSVNKSARTLLCSMAVVMTLSATPRSTEAQTSTFDTPAAPPRTLDTPTEPRPVVSATGRITPMTEYFFDPLGRDGDKVQAQLTNGLLTVTIPKPAEMVEKTKKIAVKS